MGKESTAYAKGILSGFLKRCGGAQGAILELKYGEYGKKVSGWASLKRLKADLGIVQSRIAEILSEIE